MNRVAFIGTTISLGMFLSAYAAASETIVIIQKSRDFQTKKIELKAGDDVRFTNEDEFLHQIYTSSPEFSFDSQEQAPGEIVDVKFPVVGDFKIRCGIHPKMFLDVAVR